MRLYIVGVLVALQVLKDKQKKAKFRGHFKC